MPDIIRNILNFKINSGNIIKAYTKTSKKKQGMIRFSSIIDDITFQKIKTGQKRVKFFLCDKKRTDLNIGDQFYLINHDNASLMVTVEQILISQRLNELVLKFPLQFLGECDYNIAIANLKKWFTDEEIEKYSLMGVVIKIENK